MVFNELEKRVLPGGRSSRRDLCCVSALSLASPFELDDERVPRDTRTADGDVGAGLDDDVVHQLGRHVNDVRLLGGG